MNWRDLTHNLAIKLLALLLALALWMLAKGFTNVEMDIKVPVHVRNLPRGLVVGGRLPSSVQVSVIGSRIRFMEFHPERLKLELDASNLGEGAATYGSLEKRLALPPDISVLRLYPSTISVTFERR